MDYKIIDFMHLKNERKGFIVDRPYGNSEYVFLHFINPVDIKMGDKIITTAPHACIIYSPSEPCYYASSDYEMFHNWICFSPLKNEYNPLIIGLPLNTIFYTDFGNAITKEMEGIQWFYNKNMQKEMSDGLLNILTILADERKRSKKSSLYSDNQLFDDLRFLIYQTPKNWNIDLMANFVHLSRSWFSVKYKSKFGVSPVDDLSKAAMCMAEKLLLTTTLTVQNIAHECGYDDVTYFIQKFKKYTGETPHLWKRKNAK